MPVVKLPNLDPQRPNRVYYMRDGRGCKKRVTKAGYCYGCGKYICEMCDETEVIGPHKFADHFGGRAR